MRSTEPYRNFHRQLNFLCSKTQIFFFHGPESFEFYVKECRRTFVNRNSLLLLHRDQCILIELYLQIYLIKNSFFFSYRYRYCQRNSPWVDRFIKLFIAFYLVLDERGGGERESRCNLNIESECQLTRREIWMCGWICVLAWPVTTCIQFFGEFAVSKWKCEHSIVASRFGLFAFYHEKQTQKHKVDILWCGM